MDPIGLFFLAVVAAILAYAIGYYRGMKRGKAIGWNDYYFDAIAKDCARRNRLGQFKARGVAQ